MNYFVIGGKDMQEVANDLSELTFAEFRERFSTGEGFLGQTIRTLEPPYLAPNESSFSDVFDVVHTFLEEEVYNKTLCINPNISFYGIIGGVDLTLSYIAAINPSFAVLTDINETAVDYLESRLEIFKQANTPEEYFHILENENPKAMMKIREFVANLPDKEREQIWYFNGNFDLLKNMVETGRIKAFQSDYYCGGQKVIGELIEDSNPAAVVLYLSDIRGIASNEVKMQDTFRSNEIVVRRLTNKRIPFAIIENGIKGNIITMLYDGQEV